MRKPHCFALILGGFVVSLAAAGCGDIEKTLKHVAQEALDEAAKQGGSDGSNDAPVTTSISSSAPRRTGEAVRIASFNIQVFGESKSGKPDVMNVLASVVRRFDIVAVQEIRAKSQDIIPRFCELINSDGSRYDFVIGPRLGRTSSKEQYAYVYDTTRIEVDRRSIYTVDDPKDLLHRPPMVSRFRVRGPPSDQAFTFTLVNIHTDPDETDTELDALGDVFASVQRNGSGEDDIILLGDLNVDDRHLGKLGRLPNISWVIAGEPTNTRGNHSYDNIVFNRSSTVEFLGRGGVLNLMSEFGLSMDQAIDVSDHMPVWAEFSSYENTRGRLAETNQPASAQN